MKLAVGRFALLKLALQSCLVPLVAVITHFTFKVKQMIQDISVFKMKRMSSMKWQPFITTAATHES